MINSVCILGSGTAGLISALVLKELFPNLKTTIVSSSQIGIVGVGEGSTEHWKEFMQVCNISLFELVTETDATMKSGILFDNWHGDGSYYMHALHAQYTRTMPNNVPGVLVYNLLNNKPLYPKNIYTSRHFPPVEDSVNQFHFDTNKLNSFFVKKCKERNIDVIDDTIEDVVLDQLGHIESLTGKLHNFSADLFIDASGFSRILSKKLGVKWIDCKKYLPMDSAIAFPTELDENFPSWTLSRALSSGWMWQIPTQSRYGNGYVYCSDYISDQDALDEIQQQYEGEINVGKSFRFSAGHVDKFWFKNCVSIGLSGSFVEPLEATSIGTSIQQSFALAQHILNYEKGNEKVPTMYNKEMDKVISNIIDFVQLHYISTRSDSKFWKEVQSNITLTDFNKEHIDYFKDHLPIRSHFSEPWILFHEHNWIQVLDGLRLFNKDKIREMWDKQAYKEETDQIVKEMDWNAEYHEGMTHMEALDILGLRNVVKNSGYR